MDRNSGDNLNTAVLFLVFNRLDTTKTVFEAIRSAKPTRLYVACDGARQGRPEETEKVNEIRKYIVENVDWECELKTLFREKNLGCKVAVSSAIDWLFENEEMGIILEDDCLPSSSFFDFCEELLIKYKDDTRIWHIGGTNPIDVAENTNEYYFSNYNRIWGWATWRRAWANYDVNIPMWPEIRDSNALSNFMNNRENKIFTEIFESVYQGKIDTWDYQWFLIRMLNSLAIIPKTNLVSNIGFDENATHTTDINSPLSNLKRGEIIFPLKDPLVFVTDKDRDQKWSSVITHKIGLLSKIIRRIFN